MEACESSHHWARQFQKLGHEVRLMPAMYVKADAKHGKSDAIDAEAICEAVMRPTMRFVAIKTGEQQGVLFLHRARDRCHGEQSRPYHLGSLDRKRALQNSRSITKKRNNRDARQLK